MKWFNKKAVKPKPNSACEVCGYNTYFENERGRLFICPVCFWEDDEFHEDLDEPCFVSNDELSVNEARRNYKTFGASRRQDIKHVRQPLPEEIPT